MILQVERDDIMKRYVITIYFDNKEDEELENRSYEMFELKLEANQNLQERLFKIFELKNYSWNDFNKSNKNKEITSIDHLNITDIPVW